MNEDKRPGQANRRYAQYLIWIAIPIVLLLYFPSAWMAVGFVAALALFALRWWIEGSPFIVSRANLPILILLSLTAVGFAITPAPDLAVLTAGQVVASITIFYVLLDRIQTLEDSWRVGAALVGLGILLALVAPFTADWSPKLFGLSDFYEQHWPRLEKLTNANILAGALAPIVPIALALVVQRKRSYRLLGTIALAPLFMILFLLQSRGAFFALAIGLVLWATLYRRWILPLTLLALLVVLMAGGAFGLSSLVQLLYDKPGTPTAGSLLNRQDMWMQAIFLIRQSPFFGIGLDAIPRIGPYAWPNSPSQPGASFNHAHNLFLQIALDTGVFGLAAFVALWLAAVRSILRAWRSKIDVHLAIGILAAFAVLFVHGLGDVIVWGTAKSSAVLWILFALAFAFDKVRESV
jgi:putative inorganic carbon (hco3(-)) transporter